MKNVTVVTRPGVEEVTGKSLGDVLALAKRLGHQWPAKSQRIAGLWVNTYSIEELAA